MTVRFWASTPLNRYACASFRAPLDSRRSARVGYIDARAQVRPYAPDELTPRMITKTVRSWLLCRRAEAFLSFLVLPVAAATIVDGARGTPESLVSEQVGQSLGGRGRTVGGYRGVVHDAAKPLRNDRFGDDKTAIRNTWRSLSGTVGGDREVPTVYDGLDRDPLCCFEGGAFSPRRRDPVVAGQIGPGSSDPCRQRGIRRRDLIVGDISDDMWDVSRRAPLSSAQSTLCRADQMTH